MQSQLLEPELSAFLQSQYPQFCSWLIANVKSTQSRRADRSRVNLFLGWLSRNQNRYANWDVHEAKTYAVADYLDYLHYQNNARESTIAKTMVALNLFFNIAGLGSVSVEREPLPSPEPSALDSEAKNRFEQAAYSADSIKQKAISLVVLETGMKASDCSNLNIEDFDPDSACVFVKQPTPESRKCYSLTKTAIAAVLDWLQLRLRRYQRPNEKALFVNPQRKRITPAGINLIVKKTGILADLDVSARVLRDTYLLGKSKGEEKRSPGAP